MATVNKTASIYDVAKAAEVSAGTVSRVLNGRGNFSEATVSHVLETARGMSFRSRVISRKTTLALITDKAAYATSGGFLTCLQTHLIAEMAKIDMSLELYSEATLDRLGRHTVDAIISIAWDQSTIKQLKEIHREHGTPVLTLNRSDVEEFSSVESDFYAGGKLVGHKLGAAGHKRIGYVIEEPTPGLDRRLDGLIAGLADYGVEFDRNMVAHTRHSRTESALRRIVEFKPTALFVGSEDLVLEVSSIVQDGIGLSVPSDISLVGMENVYISRYASPPIDSLRQPFEQMASEALSVISRLLKQKGKVGRKILSNEWITRNSLRVLPQG